MRNILLMLIAFASISFSKPSLAVNDWVFPMPLYRSGVLIDEVNVYTDGTNFNGVIASELSETLKNVLAREVIFEINKYGNRLIKNEELIELGVELVFDPEDLSLSLVVDSDSVKTNQLNFGSQYQPPRYSEAGNFAWHNVFNLTDNYVTNDDRDSRNSWRAEWISTGNILGHKGLNFELSGYAASRAGLNDTSEVDFYRGDARIFVDRAEYPFRISLGDVSSVPVGHQPSVNLGGGSFERLWGNLQPSRNIQNGASQDIYLAESATVSIYVNDRYYGDLRLPPGRYQIEDLPLQQGNNDIRLEIKYQSGKRETLNYSNFANTRLLKKGFSDFGLYGGVISTVEDNNYEYNSEEYVVQGYYEYGLTESVTLGSNAVYHPLGQILGATIGIGSPIGNIGARFSGLAYDDVDEFGMIGSLDYSFTTFGNLDYTNPNLRLSYEAFVDYRSVPWIIDNDLTTGMSLIGNYIYRITEDIDINTRISWDKENDTGIDDYNGSIEVNWRPGDFVFTAGVEYFNFQNEVDDDDLTYFFIAEWYWNSEDGDYSSQLQYFYPANLGRVNFSKYSNNTPGGYGYDIRADVSEDLQNYELAADYVGNRFNAEVQLQHLDDRVIDESGQLVSGRLSTALTLVDTDVSWSRGYRGPAAIVKVHESLDVPVLIEGYGDDEPESIATKSLNNTAPLYTSNTRTTVKIAVPDAPIGYDYGPDVYGITAGAYTGHIIEVGSQASKTVIGKFLSEDGAPIKLRNGVVEGMGIRRVIFTNSAGRFALDGMKSGEYVVEIIGTPSYRGVFTIAESSENLVYLEAVKLEYGGQK